MDDMKKCDMKSFAISDYKPFSVGEDTMMSTYKVIIQGRNAGEGRLRHLQRGPSGKNRRGKAGYFPTNVKEEAPAKPAGRRLLKYRSGRVAVDFGVG